MINLVKIKEKLLLNAIKQSKESNCFFIGSFDPFHIGHLNMIKQASNDFDNVYVCIVHNYNKGRRFYDEMLMIDAINKVLEKYNIKNARCVKVNKFLPIDLKKYNCKAVCRGCYNVKDKYFENLLRILNSLMNYITVYYDSKTSISSTKIRNMFEKKQDISEFVDDIIINVMKQSKRRIRIKSK